MKEQLNKDEQKKIQALERKNQEELQKKEQ